VANEFLLGLPPRLSGGARLILRRRPGAGPDQSAVSQHVAALERPTGLALIQRGTRPAELTEAGAALVRHGTAISARLDSADQELTEIAGRRAGRLRFGSFPTALTTFVPAWDSYSYGEPQGSFSSCRVGQELL